jgi:hypothetical protein
MAEKKLVFKEKLESVNLFTFNDFYSYCYAWFVEEGYKVNEEKYSEKVNGDKRDITFEWKAGKEINDYYKVESSIKFEISGLEDVEAEIDGKVKKTNKGKIKLDIKALLVIDHKNNWTSTPFLTFIRGIYDKFIIRERLNEYEENVVRSFRTFKEELKAYLDISGKR